MLGEKVTTKLTLYPAPRVTEADKKNDRRSLQRALDRRLYLLLYGATYGCPGGNPVCIFRKRSMKLNALFGSLDLNAICKKMQIHLIAMHQLARYPFAVTGQTPVLGDLSYTYFVGNAPMGHMVIQPTDDMPDTPSFKRFFFKSQVIATNKFRIGKSEDHVWVTKDELTEYFPEQAAFLDKMIIS